jgi:hypothetical protein
MSPRRVLQSTFARLFAVFLVTLAISPVTQPFSTLVVSDFLEDSAKLGFAHDGKTDTAATMVASFVSPASSAVRGTAASAVANLTLDPQRRVLVLRI